MLLATSRRSALPNAVDCSLLAAGIDWDAVRVPRSVGECCLDLLGGSCAAVVEDPREAALYWFIAAGASAGWDVAQTRPLGMTQYLVVPPLHRVAGPGLHWRIRPLEGRLITDVRALRAAVEGVIGQPGHSRHAAR
ncbi:hypothetical protein GCM10010211_32660 [Streptomyces albospinus]|uniref:LysR substrate-binding domain-containing protein n=1 Tax=Streptomyces albospinus TaxID=285515 RepID=A0ABQ2V2P3_9ACTN|nr:hypothetical protein [Streptomyces albospinus]GGU65023.1 hypothetical protein GCM10010211_32660 [Streptomyces albospinus]